MTEKYPEKTYESISPPEAASDSELERSSPPYVEVFPDEIPYDPKTQPLEFLEFCRSKLIKIGKGLPTPELEKALYRDIDLMLFCGFDGAEVQEEGTFGDRRETFCVDGIEFQQMAHDAADQNQWPTHSTISYATTQHVGTRVPAMAVFDSSKMDNFRNNSDYSRTENEYQVAEGYTMDDAAIAIFYLPE